MAIGKWGPDIEVRNNSMNVERGLITITFAYISSIWLFSLPRTDFLMYVCNPMTNLIIFHSESYVSTGDSNHCRRRASP